MASSSGKLGEHIARIVAESIVHATAATADGKAEHTRAAIDTWLEEAEAAHTPMLHDLFGELAADPDLPEKYRALFSTMAGPDHQWDWLIQLIGAVGGAISILPALGQVDVQVLLNKYWAQYPTRPLSPADLADMVERNIVGQGWAEDEAKKSGVHPNDFDLLVKDTGEPYGIEEALSLLRRGIIDEQRFTDILYYSRVRNEFLPDILNLQWDTMTAGDAVEGALKGVLSNGEAQDLFGKAGGLTSQFQTLLAIAGNPIGVEAALGLWNHGFIDESQVTQVILHSRINPAFEPMAKLLRHRFLAPYQVVQAVKAGTATVAQATEWLLADGYPADQVAAVLTANAKGATAAAKEISETQIAYMYEMGAIDKSEAEARLEALGYHADEVDFILSVYDEKRHVQLIATAIAQIKKVYLAGRIDGPTAGTQLDALGVDPNTKPTLLTVWEVEKMSELRELTPAQIGGMYKKGLMDDAGALARFTSMGYTNDDAALLLANYGGPPPAGSPAAVAAAAQPTSTTGG